METTLCGGREPRKLKTAPCGRRGPQREETVSCGKRESQWSVSKRGELQKVGITSCECGEEKGITLSC